MVTVIFIFNGKKTTILCKKEDKMKDICNHFISRFKINTNSVCFIYNENMLNMDLTFNEQANPIDNERNEMNILVYEIQKNSDIQKYRKNIIVKSKEIICPECDEDCRMSIKDFKINLYDCKNNHKTENILLNEFNYSQIIKESRIICDICKTKNKSNNDYFYKCIDCKKNICQICKLSHDCGHNIIDYNKKNYMLYS